MQDEGKPRCFPVELFFFFAQARGSDGKLMASYSRGLKAVLSHDKKLIIKYMIGPEEGS